jgi:hypothetical protein
MEIQCAYNECGVMFIASTHNQKYHTDECCRRATNARLMEQYYERKARRQGRVRVCANGCGTRLSRYNDGKICQKCESEAVANARNELWGLLNGE